MSRLALLLVLLAVAAALAPAARPAPPGCSFYVALVYPDRLLPDRLLPEPNYGQAQKAARAYPAGVATVREVCS